MVDATSPIHAFQHLRFRSDGAGEGSSSETGGTVMAWSWPLTTALLSSQSRSPADRGS